jgi:hypothetical protein
VYWCCTSSAEIDATTVELPCDGLHWGFFPRYVSRKARHLWPSKRETEIGLLHIMSRTGTKIMVRLRAYSTTVYENRRIRTPMSLLMILFDGTCYIFGLVARMPCVMLIRSYQESGSCHALAAAEILPCSSIHQTSQVHSLVLTAAACLFQRHERIELRQPALAEDFFGEPLGALSCPKAHCESFLG